MLATLELAPDGCGVIRSDFAGPVENATWAVLDRQGFQVRGINAATKTHYRPGEGAQVTVRLEGWIGEGYVPISNEVQPSC